MVKLTLYLQTEIVVDSTGSYYEVGVELQPLARGDHDSGTKLEQAQINLTDCLACRFAHYFLNLSEPLFDP